jgi:hypothetical protein
MSQLRKWVEESLKPNAERLALSARLSVRVTTEEEGKLKTIAERLNMTKTGAAEYILRAGIADAFAVLLENLEVDEAAEIVNVLEAETHYALQEEERREAEGAASGRGSVETSWEATK